MIKLLTAYEQEKLRTSDNLKSFIGKNQKLNFNAFLTLLTIPTVL